MTNNGESPSPVSWRVHQTLLPDNGEYKSTSLKYRKVAPKRLMRSNVE